MVGDLSEELEHRNDKNWASEIIVYSIDNDST